MFRSRSSAARCAVATCSRLSENHCARAAEERAGRARASTGRRRRPHGAGADWPRWGRDNGASHAVAAGSDCVTGRLASAGVIAHGGTGAGGGRTTPSSRTSSRHPFVVGVERDSRGGPGPARAELSAHGRGFCERAAGLKHQAGGCRLKHRASLGTNVINTLNDHTARRVIARREFLARAGGGIGGLALAYLLGGEGLIGAMQAAAGTLLPPNPLAPRPPHFPGKAKRVISLFMFGGISHVDTFDPKPELDKQDGVSVAGKPGFDTGGRSAPGKLMKSPWAFRPPAGAGCPFRISSQSRAGRTTSRSSAR